MIKKIFTILLFIVLLVPFGFIHAQSFTDDCQISGYFTDAYGSKVSGSVALGDSFVAVVEGYGSGCDKYTIETWVFVESGQVIQKLTGKIIPGSPAKLQFKTSRNSKYSIRYKSGNINKVLPTSIQTAGALGNIGGCNLDVNFQAGTQGKTYKLDEEVKFVGKISPSQGADCSSGVKFVAKMFMAGKELKADNAFARDMTFYDSKNVYNINFSKQILSDLGIAEEGAYNFTLQALRADNKQFNANDSVSVGSVKQNGQKPTESEVSSAGQQIVPSSGPSSGGSKSSGDTIGIPGKIKLGEKKNGGSGQLDNPIKSNSLTELMTKFLTGITVSSTVFALIFMSVATFKMVISQGDAGTIAESKRTIMWSLAGIAIVILAYSIVSAVLNILNVVVQ